MSFRKILIGMVTLWLGLMGVAFGLLFLICVTLYLFSQGLTVSVVVFSLLCISCFVIAGVVLRLGVVKRKSELTTTAHKYLGESEQTLYDESGQASNSLWRISR